VRVWSLCGSWSYLQPAFAFTFGCSYSSSRSHLCTKTLTRWPISMHLASQNFPTFDCGCSQWSPCTVVYLDLSLSLLDWNFCTRSSCLASTLVISTEEQLVEAFEIANCTWTSCWTFSEIVELFSNPFIVLKKFGLSFRGRLWFYTEQHQVLASSMAIEVHGSTLSSRSVFSFKTGLSSLQ
jgi:hypothetical protein